MIHSSYQPLFSTIRTEGALLPTDLLRRIDARDKTLGGLSAADYHLAPGETINEATNRSWTRLVGAWANFRTWLNNQAVPGPLTGETRDRWLLPLFQELGYGRLQPTRSVEQDGKLYPLSHSWGSLPIHLVGVRVDLDARTQGVVGAARSRPHSMVQEFLNGSSSHLWALVSNGLRLRILRDSARLTRQAYVEFDLEAMMEGQIYSDFVLLWLLCHQSRLEGDPPTACWLEHWSQMAQAEGTRLREQLRQGVEEAITSLGRGFLAHRANHVLRERLRNGTLTPQGYYRQLLRLVYRLIFLFVSEDRGLLLDPTTPPEARDLYTNYYSTVRLRRLAAIQRGSRHCDHYRTLQVVMNCLGRAEGGPALALPALNSFLFVSGERGSIPDLEVSNIRNHDLLDAVRALAYTVSSDARRPVDYNGLDSEELGSVYESLLELHPELHIDSAWFELKTAGGNERKTTGSYYTPAPLVRTLLDSALDPVLDIACQQPDPEDAILRLTVCDPACGSGHFLIGAARRIAHRLASIRTGEAEPDPSATRAALREVVSHCLYGVDINPMAVEICKFSLWLEALEPGKPLTFLDHHIRCGNSLIGATDKLVRSGIPDAAYEPRTGDDKVVASGLRRRNKIERETYRDHQTFQYQMDLAVTFDQLRDGVAQAAHDIDTLADTTVAEIMVKDAAFQTWLKQTAPQRSIYNLWTAAFFWRFSASDAFAPTTGAVLDAINHTDRRTPLMDQADILAERIGFFHWDLEFAEVFERRNGFDVVLGNSPWERIKIQEKEWFAVRHPDIASAPTAAARQHLISSLPNTDPLLWDQFQAALHQTDGESQFIRGSGRFPLCGRGDVNTYAVFAETDRMLVAPSGRIGCIVPSGIASDDTTKFFFQDIINNRNLVSLYSFENEEFIFPAIHHATKFCLLTINGFTGLAKAADFVFFARRTEHLLDQSRHFVLTADDIALLNPNTRTCPIFRSERDANLTKAIYQRVPVLIKDDPVEANPWNIRFMRMLDMANDSKLFQTYEQLEMEGWHLSGNVFTQDGQEYVPLYEAKMVHQFDHRFGTYLGQTKAQANQGKLPELDESEHANPWLVGIPHYWVPRTAIESRMAGRWNHEWLIGWRDITNSAATRTVVSSVLPISGCGDTILLMLPDVQDVSLIPMLLACLNSFVLDYLARQKIGGIHLKYHVFKQLPVLPPHIYTQRAPWDLGQSLADWLLPRILELVYTSWDMAPLASDCGYTGSPFLWSDERRFLLRCELDAAYFHMYRICDEDVAYILDTFPLVRRKDEATYKEYRTQRVILEMYKAMKEAIETEQPYQAVLNPPPADPRQAHPVLSSDSFPPSSVSQVPAGASVKNSLDESISGHTWPTDSAPKLASYISVQTESLATRSTTNLASPAVLSTSRPPVAQSVSDTEVATHVATPSRKDNPLEGPAQQMQLFDFGTAPILTFQVGDRVRHTTFGEGQIINVSHESDDQVLTVRFSQVGIKRLKASLARLDKL